MSMSVNTVDELISDIRQGRMVVLLDDDADRDNEGVVMVAAEHCDAGHVNFMARRARGLVCLALTRERCVQLDLPPMVGADARGEKTNFTLSIEAAEGIEARGRIDQPRIDQRQRFVMGAVGCFRFVFCVHRGHSFGRWRASACSTAMRTATPISTCSRMTLRGPSAVCASISTPRFMGPGCITIASSLA